MRTDPNESPAALHNVDTSSAALTTAPGGPLPLLAPATPSTVLVAALIIYAACALPGLLALRLACWFEEATWPSAGRRRATAVARARRRAWGSGA